MGLRLPVRRGRPVTPRTISASCPVLVMGAFVLANAIARAIRRDLLDRGYAAVIAGWARSLAPECDARSLSRLQQLVDLAERYDQVDAGLRPARFVEAARSAKVDDPASGRVRVMTAHASKGLEFDAVVLPDLDQLLSRSDARDLVVLDRDSPIDPVRGVYRRAKKDTMALLPQLENALKQRTREKRTEDLCLLYVAMTRARQALHLLVRPLTRNKKTGKPSTVGLTNLSYAAVVRQALSTREGEGFDGDELLHESGDTDWHIHAARPIVSAPAPPQPFPPIKLAKPAPDQGRAWTPTAPSAMHAGGTVSARDLLRPTATGGRAYGMVMHALFERVGFLDEAGPNGDDIDAVLAQHQSLGFDTHQLRNGFAEALQRPNTRALLARDGASALWREARSPRGSGVASCAACSIGCTCTAIRTSRHAPC